jgi:prepilin-type N-terminal cleavage/methylation domain-containing protein/prepilin-type processing-associated H-X9-DG protein
MNAPTVRPPARNAFTLIELLVTAAVIGILASLILPSLAAAKSRARRVHCVSNLRQLAVASLNYAEEDRRGSLSARTSAADESIAYLSPYTGSLSVFLCPSTRNRVGDSLAINPHSGVLELADLQVFPDSASSPRGASYMAHAFIGHHTPYSMEIPLADGSTRILPYLRKNLQNVQSYAHFHDTFGLRGTVAGPAGHWLVVDTYWRGRITAYPDLEDNHREKGVNVSYCDGHVAWVSKASFLFEYERDTDEGRVGIPLTY